MDPGGLHEQLADRVSAVFSIDAGPLADVEAHVATGCSRCARALVNARETAVALAESTVPTLPRARAATRAASAGDALRERILAGARTALVGRASAEVSPPPRRFFDAAGEVARLHVGAPGDAERVREIDALAVAAPPADDLTGRLLAQLQGLLGFPLLFVSVVRGERTGYRVQRGLDGLMGESSLAGAARDRRRETSFCTHTVSFDAPLLVPDAAAEPFFRGSTMVRRDGIRAYVGVPLRTSRGIVVGTVCMMDFVPRRLGPEVVGALQLFAEPITAEIERDRLRAERRWPRTAAGAPVHPLPWFPALLQLASVSPSDSSRPLSLLVVPPDHADALADHAHPHEPVGRIAGGQAALLLTAPASVREQRRAELSRDLGRDLEVENIAPGTAAFDTYLR